MILAQFQSLYPEGSIISELVQIHHNKYIIRVNVQAKGVTHITAMAAAESIETAEDRAIERAFKLLEKISPQNNSTNITPGEREVQVNSSEQVQSHHFDTKEKSKQANVKQITAKLPAIESTTKIVNQPLISEELISEELISEEIIAEESIAKEANPSSYTFTAQGKNESTNPSSVPNHPGSGFAVKSETPTQEINQSDFSSRGVTSNSQFQFDSPLPDNMVNTSDNQADGGQLPLMSSTNVQSFMSPERPSEGEQEITASMEKKSTASGRKKKKTETKELIQPKSLLDPIAEIDVEMRRLGWTREQGREHLIETYGKRARSLLTDEQLVEFLEYLKSQPTPADPLDPGF